MTQPESESPPTILLVEDEPMIAELERDVLESAGYRVEEQYRGDQALAFLERSHVDLVVLDYKLPDMRGDEFLAVLGARAATLPVIFITGWDDARLAERMIESGAAGFLVKNTDLRFLHELPDKVREALVRFAAK